MCRCYTDSLPQCCTHTSAAVLLVGCAARSAAVWQVPGPSSRGLQRVAQRCLRGVGQEFFAVARRQARQQGSVLGADRPAGDHDTAESIERFVPPPQRAHGKQGSGVLDLGPLGAGVMVGHGVCGFEVSGAWAVGHAHVQTKIRGRAVDGVATLGRSASIEIWLRRSAVPVLIRSTSTGI